jgi:redox-regulated HSP33 family molecular chaperone
MPTFDKFIKRYNGMLTIELNKLDDEINKLKHSEKTSKQLINEIASKELVLFSLANSIERMKDDNQDLYEQLDKLQKIYETVEKTREQEKSTSAILHKKIDDINMKINKPSQSIYLDQSTMLV